MDGCGLTMFLKPANCIFIILFLQTSHVDTDYDRSLLPNNELNRLQDRTDNSDPVAMKDNFDFNDRSKKECSKRYII